ncbi:hypothetical protein D9M69_673440 [compost metagenome]
MVIVTCLPNCVVIFASAAMVAAGRRHVVAVLAFVVVHLGFATAVLVTTTAGN